MRSIKQKFLLLAGGLWILGSVSACAMGDNTAKPEAQGSSEPREVAVFQTWSGDYPVSRLQDLPEEQQASRLGYIGDKETFTEVWPSFKPGESLPTVDLTKNLVVFTRNTTFYNRTNIVKVVLESGIAEILAMETMSALPIEDRVAMAMAVIPRDGVEFIDSGEKLIPVK